ncbi:MAG: peptidase E [Anaerolineae bacterium]|nr:peptidase E [Anaerolineae bacterium]MCI0610453.1 peptidase E [Anaerolineae bacterium]
MKLLLSSFPVSTPHQVKVLAALGGKPIAEIKIAYIENAYDVYDDEESLIKGREELRAKGWDVELVDLRNWKNLQDREALRQKLESKDVFLFAGGNPFYLRWLLKVTGADEIITDLVKQGKVYSGASAGGVVAGPTLRFFDNQDDPNEAEEVIWDGLNLTQIVPIPHIDNKEYGAGCREAGEALKAEGYTTQPITDAQALVINGDHFEVI